MNNRRRSIRPLAAAAVLLPVVFSFLLSDSSSRAASWEHHFNVLGPTDFVRSDNKPFLESRSFSIPSATTAYRLRIVNGGAHGEFKKVSSASVWLNGRLVVRPNQFNQNVSEIVVPVTPAAENRLQVESRSLPGSGFTLHVIGMDDLSPTLSDFMPEDGETLPDPEVNLTGLVSDTLSGVATVTCRANNTTSDAVVNTDQPVGDAFVFACSLPLVLGSNSITVEATDVAGNVSTSNLTVHHVLPPKIKINSPDNLDLFFASPITVTGTVDDPSATVSVNDIPASVTNGVFTASVPVANGFHKINAVAQNVAGSGNDSVQVFVIDLNFSPTVGIRSPDQGFVLGAKEEAGKSVPVRVLGWVRDNRLIPTGSAQVTVRFNGSPVAATVSQELSPECLSPTRCWRYSATQEFPSPTGLLLSIDVEASTGQQTASEQVSGIVDFCVRCTGNTCGDSACAASLFQRPGCVQSRRCIVNSDGCSAPLPDPYRNNPTQGTLGLIPTAFGENEDDTTPKGALTVFGQPRPIQLPCNRHDECYHQLCPQEQTIGGAFREKAACNMRFFNDLKAVCQRAYPESTCPAGRIGLLNCVRWRFEKTACYSWARNYYFGVIADTDRYAFHATYYSWPYSNDDSDYPRFVTCQGCPPVP